MTTKKLTKLLALYLPYILLGLVATNIGEAWRLAEGKELGDKIMAMMGTVPVAFANPLPSLHPLDLLVGLCCGAGLRLAVYLRGKNAKKYRHGMEYGSARWGTAKDIEPFMAPKFADNIILTKTERLMMSNRPPDPKNARNKNVLVVGGSGSGKTRFWLKPNLLQCHSSYVVTDPKGSIVVECGNALLKNGYKLKILNTINFKKSMHYNPFAYVHSEKDILKLVTTLMTNTKGEGSGGDPFWEKSERLLLTALIAYLHIDFTVLLTHIGFEEDKHLARQLDPAWGVDLIIGGHSHTLPEHAVEENGVVIAQAGTGTDQIGRFDIIVDTDNNCIDSYTWRTVPICAETCPRNPAMEQVLHRFTSQVDEKYSHIVGRFRRELTHPQRTQETELGNLFADIFTRSLGIDVMLIGSGSIRAEKLGPIVTYGDLIEGFPYDDGVFMFKVTGQQLRQMLRYMLREEAYAGHTEFYQLPSTLRLRYDRRKGDFDYFTYCGREVGKEIGDDALFTVGLQNYHFKNIESFFNISYDTICKLQKPRSVATSCQDILMEYFREHEMLDAAVDGRMTILAPDGTAR